MKTKRLLISLTICSLLIATSASAAVVADGTLGTSVSTAGSTYTIGAGTLRGSNLFQSLSQFNLTAREIALFSGSAGISNIIARITGGSSSIDGIIRSQSNANLYLLNPAGIMFGSNASLDVKGSFHASTADYLQFGQDRFYSDPQLPVPVSITAPDPTAFGFLRPNPAAITVTGSLLTVPQGKSISIVAGDINISDANLWAYGGTINLVSVASPGEVAYNGVSMTPQGFSSLGSISVTENRDFSLQPVYSGTGTFMDGLGMANLDASGPGGGKIIIRSGSFYMSGASMYNDTYGSTAPGIIDISVSGDVSLVRTNITANSYAGSIPSASIAITGTNLLFTDNTVIISDSFSSANGSDISLTALNKITLQDPGTTVSVNANGGGRAGNLKIEAPIVLIGSGATVSSSAPATKVGPVNYGAGTLTINAGQSLTLLGGITTDTAAGSPGRITIRTQNLTISGDGLISTSLQTGADPVFGRSGDIDIAAGNITMSGNGLIQSRVFYSNNASGGNIRINAANLTLLDQASISSSIDSNAGTGGSIDIRATGNIVVSSNPQQTQANVNELVGRSIASNATFGDGGHMRLEAANITVNNGATLSTIAQKGTGTGGDITLIAHDTLTVEGSGTGAASSVQTDILNAGHAGSTTVSASQVVLRDNGLISSAALPGSTGAAGNISISAQDSISLNSSAISTQSALSEGGNITISVPGVMKVTRSDITSSVTGGNGNGGNVTIDAGYMTLNNGLIRAQAEFGNGGNLLITVDKMFIKSFDGLLSASSRFGQQGTVVVNAPNTDVAGALALPVFDILNMNAFIPKRCMAADELNASTFRLLGSDGLPASPENSFPIF
ncbi:MAG: filamentous hemagglutinin N-terminal domain-containing protein [Desulfuromonadales bacterium]|nr:filamentous hemagglutinin N-terminal domain-containing protein [Desulfuromonadales bacterium]